MTGRVQPSSEARYCEIVVKGEFGEILSETFGDVDVEVGRGRTVLTVEIADESHFYGLFDRLRDLAIEVISMREIPSPH